MNIARRVFFVVTLFCATLLFTEVSLAFDDFGESPVRIGVEQGGEVRACVSAGTAAAVLDKLSEGWRSGVTLFDEYAKWKPGPTRECVKGYFGFEVTGIYLSRIVRGPNGQRLKIYVLQAETNMQNPRIFFIITARVVVTKNGQVHGGI